jgi:hypothetical protein
MRIKGREDADFTIHEYDPPEIMAEDRWYKKIDYNNLNIPIVGRPDKRGSRIDFTAYGNLPDLALSIKEAARGRFKNSNDVHRSAHYIGIRMLEEMFISMNGDSRKKIFSSKIDAALEVNEEESVTRRGVREIIKKVFDDVNDGIQEEEVAWPFLMECLDNIKDPNLRAWAHEDADRIYCDSEEKSKSLRRLYNKKYYEKKKELKLEVYGNE